MKNQIDYKSLYLKKYKNIPNYYFWGTLITVSLAAIVVGIIFLAEASYDEDYLLGVGIILGGIIVGWGLAYFNRFISAIALSQKVVVADTLLSMKDDTASTATEDELPEL